MATVDAEDQVLGLGKRDGGKTNDTRSMSLERENHELVTELLEDFFGKCCVSRNGDSEGEGSYRGYTCADRAAETAVCRLVGQRKTRWGSAHRHSRRA